METQKITIGSIYADLNQGISAEFHYPADFDRSKKIPDHHLRPTLSAAAKNKPPATSMPKRLPKRATSPSPLTRATKAKAAANRDAWKTPPTASRIFPSSSIT